MSLRVEPITPDSVARPFPLGRNKRHSSFSPSPVLPQVSPSMQSYGVSGILGGLREHSEDELGGASRLHLEEALKGSWKEIDELRARLDKLETMLTRTEVQRTSLEATVTSLQARFDEALAEQSRLEGDLEGRDELLDKLRARITEAERQIRDCTKKASEQEKSFDAEREALQAQEPPLQQRIRYFLSSRTNTRETGGANASELQEELASLNVSHSTLLAQLHTLSKEVIGLRRGNAVLKEENEGWELLVRQQTLNGRVRDHGLLARMDGRENVEEGLSQLEALDEEMEMEELNANLEAQSPILGDADGLAKDLDEGAGAACTMSPDGRLKPPSRRRKSRRSSLAPLHEQTDESREGLSLAAELGLVDAIDEKAAKKDEAEALKNELKSLKEENKALTMYCSKIIDRIISQPGFEYILSVDYKTRRNGRSVSGSSRGNLRDITDAMQAASVSEVTQSPKEEKEVNLPPEGEKKARPLSMMVRAMSGSVEKSLPTPPAQPDIEAEAKENKSEKRARRGFSLDFRSLGFGSSPASPTGPKTTSSLRPLTLSNRNVSSGKSALGRRLEKEDEDEEDRRERHNLEATLKLMGVDRERQGPVAPSVPASPRKLTKSNKAHPGEERESLIGAALQDELPGGTPQSHNSSTADPSPMVPLSPVFANDKGGLAPEAIAQAALRAFDEREKDQARQLSKGQSGGFTSPPLSVTRRGRRPAADRSCDQGMGEFGVSPVRGRGMKGSGSISTLWSMGSSRPNSQEFTTQT